MTLSHTTDRLTSTTPGDSDAQIIVQQLREAMVEKYRPLVAAAPAPSASRPAWSTK